MSNTDIDFAHNGTIQVSTYVHHFTGTILTALTLSYKRRGVLIHHFAAHNRKRSLLPHKP